MGVESRDWKKENRLISYCLSINPCSAKWLNVDYNRTLLGSHSFIQKEERDCNGLFSGVNITLFPDSIITNEDL